MKFSVIIPAYNCEKYIKKCIKSITECGYKDLEIIVVNDGSTDKTESVVKDMIKKDKRIKLFSQTNSGVSVARNTGVVNATGKYIHFVDADDSINGNPYELAANIIKKEKVDIIRFNYYFDNNGTLENNVERKKLNEKIIDNKFSREQLIPLILNEDIKAYIWQMIIKKEMIVQFDESLAILEDENAVISILCEIEKGFLTDECFYNYNVSNTNSATRSIDKIEKMMKNMLRANRVIKKNMENNDINTKENLIIFDSRMAHSFCNYLEQLYLLEKNFKRAKEHFRKIVDGQNLKKVFRYLSYNKLSFRHRITTFLTINRLYNLLYIIYFYKRRTK